MKAIKNIFGTKKENRNFNKFLSELDFNAMSKVKGGESDDTWPPEDGGSEPTSTSSSN